jgi:hypothetical protein
LRNYENATKEAETDQKEKEKGSQRTAKVSDQTYGHTLFSQNLGGMGDRWLGDDKTTTGDG